MSLTGYLYILPIICTVQITCLVHIYEHNRLFVHLQVICTVQVTCLEHIYEPIELIAISMYISNTVSVLFSNTFVSLTGYLYTLQVICTVQVTCLEHIYEPIELLPISMYISNTVSVQFLTHL